MAARDGVADNKLPSTHDAHGTPKQGILEGSLSENSFFESPNQPKTNTRKKRLSPFFNHFNSRDLKELFKCSLAVWVMTLFIVIDPLLKTEGQGIFFACILMFIIPPSGIVFLQLMISFTILVGMALAWAWGVITMKAALAARPQADTNARLALLQQEASQNTTYVRQLSGQTAYAEVLVFEGFMLDARVVAVYFCMICPFIYLLARLRVVAPKLILVQMFGTIIADIFLTTAPLLPSFSGTIPQLLVKPAATAVAIGVACNILFFPESTSHIVLGNIKQLIGPMGEFVDACRLSFDNSAKPMNLARLREAKSAGIASYKTLEDRLGFLPLDVSICRWDAQDIARLKAPLKNVFATWISLLESQITRAESRARFNQLEEHDEARQKGLTSEGRRIFGQHQVTQQLDFARLFRDAESEDLIVKSIAALKETSDPVLLSCKQATDAIVEILTLVNEKKFYARPSAATWKATHTKHSEILETLRRDGKDFIANTPSRLLDPHAHFFDENDCLDPPSNSDFPPMRGVILGLILEECIVNFADALEALLRQIVALEEQRSRTRLWLPTGLRQLGTWVFGRQATPHVASTSPELEEEQAKSKPKHRRRDVRKTKEGSNEKSEETTSDQLTAIHLHRGKQRSRASRILLSVIHWLTNTEGMFALRVLIVTIALAIPAVLTSSAGFYYREKGLWALIMGQVSLVPYAADFTWGMILRVLGTVLGGVIGMVAWYIGSGSGDGNSYGIAAVMVPVIIVLMYGRLFSPPPFIAAFVLTGATAYLTLAYSWIDTHIPSYGNPGVGYQVFWRRVLLVMIGFAAAALVMYFPRPPSAGRHYRRVLSATLSKFNDLYALFITDLTRNDGKGDRNPDLISTLETTFIGTADTLSSIAGPIHLLRFEFSSSDFTASGLSRMTSLATTVNFNLFQLFYYSSQLPGDFRKQLRSLSGVFEEHFVGDFMAILTLLGHSLATGEALPSVLSTPLVVRAFRDHAGPFKAPMNSRSSKVKDMDGSSDTKGEHVRRVLGTVTRDMIVNEEAGFRKYCVVLSALIGLLNAVDEMVLVIKEELGESHIVDIEGWGSDIYPDPETQWLMDEQAEDERARSKED